MKISTLFFALAIFSLGCNSQQSESSTGDTSNVITQDTSTASAGSVQQSQNNDTSSNLKVYVDQSGNITANGQSVSLTVLETMLQILKSKNGIVYYSRDNVAADPPPQSMQVMDLVAKYELPIQFYTDKTFTQPFGLQ